MPKTLLIYSTGSPCPDNTFANILGGGSSNANEIDTQYSATRSAIFSNLRTFVGTGGTGVNTARFRKNSADGEMTCAVTGTGVASDLVNTDSVIAGDVFSVGLDSTGTDPLYRYITANCEFDNAHGSFHSAGSFSAGVICDVPSTTRFLPIHGSMVADGVTTEANVQWKVRGYTSINEFQVRILANARVNDTVFKLRVNGVDVDESTITVETLTTGLFTVTDIDQALSPGDLVCASITTLTGTEDITITLCGATFLSTNNASELWAGAPSGTSRTASATASNYIIGAGINAVTAITNMGVYPGFPADLKNLRIFLISNTYAADAQFNLMVNEEVAMTTTITAAATGWLENTDDKVTITSEDRVGIQIVGGTSGSISIAMMGVTLWNPTPVNPSVIGDNPRHSGGRGPGPKMRNHPWPQFCLVDP